MAGLRADLPYEIWTCVSWRGRFRKMAGLEADLPYAIWTCVTWRGRFQKMAGLRADLPYECCRTKLSTDGFPLSRD
jgi:hypothetical protein